MEIADDRHAIALRDLLASSDCIQQVPLQPTHRDGGTLDLVVTKAEYDVNDLTVDPPGIISDHSVINFHHQPPIVLEREARHWSKLNKEAFRSALLNSDLCNVDHRPDSAEAYFDMYHNILQSLADQFAPVKKVTI